MAAHPTRLSRARLALALLLPILTFTAPPVRAIQLRWSTGATDLTVSENTQAVLIVQADSAEATLPNSWRLLWTADTSLVQISAADSSTACSTDTARVYEVDPPSTPADSAANQVTAHFCSSGSAAAPTAYFLVDLVGDTHGKLKVVALDPSDTTQALESNEVTFDGGIDGDYLPVILAASSSRHSLQLSVQAVGSGLSGPKTVTLLAPNGLWKVSLGVVAQSNTALTATADIAANVPSCLLQATTNVGSASAPLAANNSFGPQNSEWAPSLMQEAFTQPEKAALTLVPPQGRIQPKDFAFLFAQHKFHIFYIRENQWDTTYARHSRGDSTEKNLGHVRSWDLVNDWKWVLPPATTPIDTIAFSVRPGAWDGFHVWAPYIIQNQADSLFYMFYTGVGDTVVSGGSHRHHQRLGVAT